MSSYYKSKHAEKSRRYDWDCHIFCMVWTHQQLHSRQISCWTSSILFNKLVCFSLSLVHSSQFFLGSFRSHKHTQASFANVKDIACFSWNLMQVHGPNHIWEISIRDEWFSWIHLTRIFKQGQGQTEEWIAFYWHQSLHKLLRPRLHLLHVWAWTRDFQDRRFLPTKFTKKWCPYWRICM